VKIFPLNETSGNHFRLPDETHVSRVHLRTADLDRALTFYQRVIGLSLVDRGKSDASLSATGNAPAILIFTETPDAVQAPHRVTGLYHFAIRFPTRRDLAHALGRITTAGYPIKGASDHGVAESIHVSDPDGNGVELYYDRPRSEWPMRGGKHQLIIEPLDFDSLLATSRDTFVPVGVPPQTDIGHLNLHVADLKEGERFFHEFLGLEVMARISDSATFLAAGGYHHHIAVNTWGGKTSAPANSTGLISYRLAVANAQTIREVKERAGLFGYQAVMAGDVLQVGDPNGHLLELETALARD